MRTNILKILTTFAILSACTNYDNYRYQDPQTVRLETTVKSESSLDGSQRTLEISAPLLKEGNFGENDISLKIVGKIRNDGHEQYHLHIRDNFSYEVYPTESSLALDTGPLDLETAAVDDLETGSLELDTSKREKYSLEIVDQRGRAIFPKTVVLAVVNESCSEPYTSREYRDYCEPEYDSEGEYSGETCTSESELVDHPGVCSGSRFIRHQVNKQELRKVADTGGETVLRISPTLGRAIPAGYVQGFLDEVDIQLFRAGL